MTKEKYKECIQNSAYDLIQLDCEKCVKLKF